MGVKTEIEIRPLLEGGADRVLGVVRRYPLGDVSRSKVLSEPKDRGHGRRDQASGLPQASPGGRHDLEHPWRRWHDGP